MRMTGKPIRGGWGLAPDADGVGATLTAHEDWMAGMLAVVADDLAAKHARMARSPFAFLRATFPLWLERAPFRRDRDGILVASVGDAHAENFGTWRDVEGRLIYGVNDFDEVAPLPFDNDLVRLTASTLLAPGHDRDGRDIAKAVIAGYRDGLANPRPCLPDERDLWLRPHVAVDDTRRERFWREVEVLPAAAPPADARAVLREALPEGAGAPAFFRRQAGLGSLGKPRYVAVAGYVGGRVLREVKAFLPSIQRMAGPAGKAATADLATSVARGPSRAPDPAWRIRDGWILRRLTASSRKIELKELGDRLADDLLTIMGRDIGAIHAASGQAVAIAAELDRRPKRWLVDAGAAAAADVTACFEAFVRG